MQVPTYWGYTYNPVPMQPSPSCPDDNCTTITAHCPGTDYTCRPAPQENDDCWKCPPKARPSPWWNITDDGNALDVTVISCAFSIGLCCIPDFSASVAPPCHDCPPSLYHLHLIICRILCKPTAFLVLICGIFSLLLALDTADALLWYKHGRSVAQLWLCRMLWEQVAFGLRTSSTQLSVDPCHIVKQTSGTWSADLTCTAPDVSK